MAQIVIDGIDDGTLSGLNALAAAAGRSAEEMARDILASAVPSKPGDRLAKADRIRAMGPGGVGTDSWGLIREERDSR